MGVRRRIRETIWNASPVLFNIIDRNRVAQVFSIGIYTGPTPLALRSPRFVKNPVLSHECVTDVPAEFVADPFMIRSGDRWCLFFEIMGKVTRRGSIGLATSTDRRTWHYEHVVIDEPFHLAYPYVFRHRGRYYLIPDSPDRGVRLYTATEFPHRWEYVETLLEGGRFSDSSIFEYDGGWWMLSAWSPQPSDVKCLRLFYADRPTGPWQEHPQSPVVQNRLNGTRPAGRVVVIDGKPVRFAQDVRPYYGCRVRAFEIHQLDRNTYAERSIRSGKPILQGEGRGWNADGMHHVDAQQLEDGSWIACVDGWYATA